MPGCVRITTLGLDMSVQSEDHPRRAVVAALRGWRQSEPRLKRGEFGEHRFAPKRNRSRDLEVHPRAPTRSNRSGLPPAPITITPRLCSARSRPP